MKTILFIFCLFSVACVTSGPKPRSVASLACLDCDKGLQKDGRVTQVNQNIRAVASKKCTIENYKDIVYQDNAEPPKCNLRGANLRGIDLQKVDFREAYLVMADLFGADLQGADLQGAVLLYANLIYADLRGANLQGANLREASLLGAYLQGADLQGADLTDVRVSCAQAEYLEAQGITGFKSPGWFICLFE